MLCVLFKASLSSYLYSHSRWFFSRKFTVSWLIFRAFYLVPSISRLWFIVLSCICFSYGFKRYREAFLCRWWQYLVECPAYTQIRHTSCLWYEGLSSLFCCRAVVLSSHCITFSLPPFCLPVTELVTIEPLSFKCFSHSGCCLRLLRHLLILISVFFQSVSADGRVGAWPVRQIEYFPVVCVGNFLFPLVWQPPFC